MSRKEYRLPESFSEAEQLRIISAYQDDVALCDIARRFKSTSSTIKRVLANNGIVWVRQKEQLKCSAPLAVRFNAWYRK